MVGVWFVIFFGSVSILDNKDGFAWYVSRAGVTTKETSGAKAVYKVDSRE